MIFEIETPERKVSNFWKKPAGKKRQRGCLVKVNDINSRSEVRLLRASSLVVYINGGSGPKTSKWKTQIS